MKKAIGMFALGMVFLIALAGFSSAAYYGGYFDSYYGHGDYDSYHSYTERTSGGFYGPRRTTSTSYDRVNEKYWDGYDWVDRTYYVREKRQSPSYGSWGYGSHPAYLQPSYGYYDYYPSYNYGGYYSRNRYW